MASKKTVLLGLVFALSVVFFWLAINQYVLPSRAQLGSNLQVVPHATSVECNPQGECYVHILGSTDVKNAVAGVSGVVQYGEGLEPVRLDQLGVCAQSSLGLDQKFQFTVDKQAKTVTFAVAALKDDASLKGGNGCITTVVFKPVNITTTPYSTKIVLAQPTVWKAGGLLQGQRSALQVQLDGTTIQVKIDPSVVWPPVGQATPMPSGQPTCKKEAGDCNCDGRSDLVDFEDIRSYTKQEGKVCDVNNDGKGDEKDIQQWLQNNSLLRSTIF